MPLTIKDVSRSLNSLFLVVLGVWSEREVLGVRCERVVLGISERASQPRGEGLEHFCHSCSARRVKLMVRVC